MSVLSAIERLFRSDAIASVEGMVGAGVSPSVIISRLAEQVGGDIGVARTAAGVFLSRVEEGIRHGNIVEVGGQYSLAEVPVNMALPSDVALRYRVKVVVEIPNPFDPTKPQQHSTMVTVDSDVELDPGEVRRRAELAARQKGQQAGRGPSPGFELAVNKPAAFIREATIQSVYRS